MSGCPWLERPGCAPDIPNAAYSLACAQICEPTRDTSTRWPLPLLLRAMTAARIPFAMLWLAMKSAMVTPTGVGLPPFTPVVEMRPPAACPARSAPSRPASGPIGPNTVPVA
ncbi:unannotated protein [freshwater metagenome]